MNSETLEIRSYRKKYQVNFTSAAFSDLATLLRKDDWILIDSNIKRVYREHLRELPEHVRMIEIPDNENSKSYDGVRPVIQQLIENNFKKRNRLVAIGGGVTQDVTAFVASILYRGVDWFFIPTSLIAQCDSCIGSKTSINFDKYKNQIGGFWPPSIILIDSSLLKSLDEKHFRSGLGEMSHYFLVDGEEPFARFEASLPEAFTPGPVLQNLIRESLSIKKSMVEIDEFDEGPRRVFNYGHSFAHAIEAYTDYTIPHGIAVSYGIDIANDVSVSKGFLGSSDRDRVRSCMRKIRSTVPLPDIELDLFLSYLLKDKKNSNETLSLVLTKGLGKMLLVELTPDREFQTILRRCFDSFKLESSQANEN